MTLHPNYPSLPVKDPDNLLMGRVVDRLIAQLINLGVEKVPLGSSKSPWLFFVCVWNWIRSKWNGRRAAISEGEETVRRRSVREFQWLLRKRLL